MSYNIDTFRVVKNDNFRIQMQAFDDLAELDGETEIIENGKSIYVRLGVEGGEIEGALSEDGEALFVKRFAYYGSGSGHHWHDRMEPLLANHSAGELVAVMVWEGGDALQRVTIKNGQIDYENLYAQLEQQQPDPLLHIVTATLPPTRNIDAMVRLAVYLDFQLGRSLREEPLIYSDILTAIASFTHGTIREMERQTARQGNPVDPHELRNTMLAILYRFLLFAEEPPHE